MNRYFTFLFLLILLGCQSKMDHDAPWSDIFSDRSELFETIISHPDSFEVQIIYGQIYRKENAIEIKRHYFNYDSTKYFYPASTVKMPVAFLSMEYINELSKANSNIDIYSSILFDSIAPPQTTFHYDSCSTTGHPNVAHLVEKVFSISDNNAYNRLYELMGQDYINERLREKGIFTNSRIRTRVGVSGFDTESNKYTNPYKIVDPDGRLLYEQDEYYALYSAFPPLGDAHKGIGYFDDELDSIVYEPFDMSEKNFINLKDLMGSLERIIIPDAYDAQDQFLITEDQRKFLLKAMSAYPSDYQYLASDSSYYDSYVKFFMYGDQKGDIPEHISIYNKVGWAYGYLTDCAYIHDLSNEIEFFLTAVIHVNQNQIYNDGIYEYESIGIPFLSELGRAVYQYERDSKL